MRIAGREHPGGLSQRRVVYNMLDEHVAQANAPVLLNDKDIHQVGKDSIVCDHPGKTDQFVVVLVQTKAERVGN